MFCSTVTLYANRLFYWYTPHRYDIYAVIYHTSKGGDSWWVRFSSQIYLEQADFVRFGNAVLEILEDDVEKSTEE